MKITVLCGGLSNERDVSLSSGTCIARALRERGHSVALIDLFLGFDGGEEDIDALFTSEEHNAAFAVGEAAPDIESVMAMRPGQGRIGPRVLDICARGDIVFLALHGDEGENGKLQGLFDLYGIRYTGSGSLGSAVAMNKSLTKTILRQAGVSVPGGLTLHKGAGSYENPGFPCVVKPCSGGSSVGTTIVQGPEEYDAALALAFRYEDSVLAEPFIRGRELTVGVLDGKAMPVIEIIPKSGFYDYKNKYQPGATVELCPAPLTEEETALAQNTAETVYRALGIEAYGRCDFILDNETGVLYTLEANTLPGMTPTSLVPQMGVAMGMDFGTLCEELIRVSLKKYE